MRLTNKFVTYEYNDNVLENSRTRSSRPEVFCKDKSYQKFCKIHRKTPVRESLF